MDRVILDASVLSKLPQLNQPLQFCDSAGRILGQFTPMFDPSAWEGLEPPFSPDELQRRRDEPGKNYTTQEVLNHLEKL